ncbi:ABC transporter ATP-binding protein [Pseudonocardia sp. RS010]|uniref:ABC transporter ATP-binding protein n=1 Tax=Pseudonocardia sp. RS010 TaxID=3385979 RepID=UPI00399F9627
MLEVTGLAAGYRAGTTVLTDVGLTLDAGSALGVMGRNGAGKSCLALTLAGMLAATAGTVSLSGRELSRTGVRGRVAAGLSLVPEGRLVFGQLTVRENLLAAAHGARRRLRRADVDAVGDRFAVLARKIDDRAAGLSGGEQQMLAVARALVQHPSVIVLDEPALGLAPVAVGTLAETLRAIMTDGVALLLMEQNRELLGGVCERTLLLDEGRVVRELSAESLRDDTAIAGTYLGR